MAPAANPNRWWSLLGLCTFTALVWLTATDMSIALPTVGKAFRASMDSMQWAVSGYFLAGSLIIVGGRLGDLKGRRLVFFGGGALLLIGSVVAATSSGNEQLVVGRVIQGIGAAAILPSSLALVAVGFPDKERPKAVAIWIATAWVGQGVGPLIGGGLVDALGWQAIFWINLPLGLLALLLVWKTTPESSSDDGGKLDIPGAVILMGALVMLSYALVSFDTAKTGELVALFVGAVVLFAAFALVEKRTKDPLVPLSVFKRPKFMAAVSANLLANVSFAVVVFLMALYLQIVLNESAFVSGAMLLPATAAILICNAIGERWTRQGRFLLSIGLGMGFLAAGCVVLTFLTGTYGSLLPGLILVGIGVGLQITPATELAVTTSGTGEGVASGVYKATSMIGGSVGVAAATTVFQSVATKKIEDAIAKSTKAFEGWKATDLLDVMTGSESPIGLTVTAKSGVNKAFEIAAGDAMWVGAAAAILGLILAFTLLTNRSKRRTRTA